MRADHDAIVVGGGAAGLMCAITAARRGRRVLVLEHTQRCGKKILMSGGGRCNFTNLGTTPAQFLSANPHYCKSALARYSPQDFLALVQTHRIGWHEKELVSALQRLGVARTRLAALEAQAGETQSVGFDPEEAAHLEQLHAELEEARRKASGRFGKRHADRVESLEVNERLVLDRLGVASYDEFVQVRAERVHTTVEVVDPVVLEFARREVADAEAAFLELQSLEVVADDPADEVEDSDELDRGDEPGGDARTQSA